MTLVMRVFDIRVLQQDRNGVISVPNRHPIKQYPFQIVTGGTRPSLKFMLRRLRTVKLKTGSIESTLKKCVFSIVTKLKVD